MDGGDAALLPVEVAQVRHHVLHLGRHQRRDVVSQRRPARVDQVQCVHGVAQKFLDRDRSLKMDNGGENTKTQIIYSENVKSISGGLISAK